MLSDVQTRDLTGSPNAIPRDVHFANNAKLSMKSILVFRAWATSQTGIIALIS